MTMKLQVTSRLKCILITLSLCIMCAFISTPAQFNSDIFTIYGEFGLFPEVISQEHQLDIFATVFEGRVGIVALFHPQIRANLSVATGQPYPNTLEQRVGEGFNKKTILVNTACVVWEPELLERAAFIAGKMDNPIYKVGNTELLWDDDITLEGIAISSWLDTNGTISRFGTMGGFLIQQRETETDAFFYTTQLGLKVNVGYTSDIILGGGGYIFTGIKGFKSIYIDEQGESLFYNNKHNRADNTYDTHFAITEFFGQFSSMVMENLPYSIYVQVVNNWAAPTLSHGVIAGFTVGRLSQKGDWQVQFLNRLLEHNAAFGAFTDSDFGNGGTGNSGYEASFAYAIIKSLHLSTQFFLSDVDIYPGYKHFKSRVKLQAFF